MPEQGKGPQDATTVWLTPEELAEQLLPVMREGLPVTDATAGRYLPHFRVVLAYARGTDRLARVLALDDVLREILTDMPNTTTGNATRMLFGLPPADRHWNLTRRREACARSLNYDTDHFRKHIEPKLLMDVVYEFMRRNARYKPKNWPITDIRVGRHEFDHIDALDRAELQARIGAGIYTCRAEVYLTQRAVLTGESAQTDARNAAGRALYSYAELLHHVREYTRSHGERILVNGTEKSLDDLIEMADMRGPFTKEEAALLLAAASRATGWEEMVEELRHETRSGPTILEKWWVWARPEQG